MRSVNRRKKKTHIYDAFRFFHAKTKFSPINRRRFVSLIVLHIRISWMCNFSHTNFLDAKNVGVRHRQTSKNRADRCALPINCTENSSHFIFDSHLLRREPEQVAASVFVSAAVVFDGVLIAEMRS